MKKLFNWCETALLEEKTLEEFIALDPAKAQRAIEKGIVQVKVIKQIVVFTEEEPEAKGAIATILNAINPFA